MPKAAIDEDGNFEVGKDNVRFSRDVSCVFLPSLQSHSCKHGPKASLQFRTLALDSLHSPSAVFRGEIVGHFPARRVGRLATDVEAAARHFQPEGSTHASLSRRWQGRKLRHRIR